MKKVLCMLLLFTLMTQALIIGAWAVCEPSDGTVPKSDGYLMKLSEHTPVMSNIEEVLPDVYKIDSAQEARSYIESGLVDYIEPNYCATLCEEEPPNDGSTQGWAFERMDAGYAEGLSLDGSGVRIAIIDSGLDVGKADLQNAHISDSYDYTLDTAVMTDTLGHGTYVAQMIAGDDNGKGTTGIARNATIIPLRCFQGKDDGSVANLARAIRDAVDVYHCDVINMSWALPQNQQTLKDAIDYAYAAGAILVAAAGNKVSADAANTLLYPAAYENVIGVGSVDSALTVAPKSEQTAAVFVCAPGEGVPVISNSGMAENVSGTSFAAPCVAAAAALLKQLSPQMTGSEISSALKERAKDLGDAGYDTAYGNGLVDLENLLANTWSHLTVSADGYLVSGWLRQDGGGIVTAADYTAAGRMKQCVLKSGDTPIFGFGLELSTGQELAKIKVLLSDENWNALAEPAVYPIS